MTGTQRVAQPTKQLDRFKFSISELAKRLCSQSRSGIGRSTVIFSPQGQFAFIGYT